MAFSRAFIHSIGCVDHDLRAPAVKAKIKMGLGAARERILAVTNVVIVSIETHPWPPVSQFATLAYSMKKPG
jgi:hypothetical protein